MSEAVSAFTTTELSRSYRTVIDHARSNPRTGALIRDGGDGVLLRLTLASDLEEQEAARRYTDMLLPLAIRGVDGDMPSDFPGVGWLAHLPVAARKDFIRGSLERLLDAVDGGGFSPLDRWVREWREEALLHRAGILGDGRDEAVEAAEQPRRR